jgi:hypothetical protein
VAGFCEFGNDGSYSIKGGEFIDHLSDYQLLNFNSAQFMHAESGMKYLYSSMKCRVKLKSFSLSHLNISTRPVDCS